MNELEYPKDRFEAIFVDGASTDGTPEAIDRLKEGGRPFIRLIRQPTRQGYNAAIYEGIATLTFTAHADNFPHLSQSDGGVNSDWNFVGQNQQNTWYSPQTLINPFNVGQLKLLWGVPLQGTAGTPIVSNSMVYVAGGGGILELIRLWP